MPAPPEQAPLEDADKKTTSAWQRAAGAAIVAILVMVSGIASGAIHVTTTAADPPPVTTVPPVTLPPIPSTTPTTLPPVSTTIAPTTTTVPVPTTTTKPPGGFPGASNTGVPAGVTLTPYAGPTTITQCGTVIDGKTISSGIDVRVGNGTRSASTPCVTIKNSVIKGEVGVGYASQGFGPLVLTDVEIDAPQGTSGATLRQANWYATRVNLHGGGYGGTQCDGYCVLKDSWVHGYFFVAPRHYDAFVSNGAYGNPITLDHNRLECSFVSSSSGDGGCSAPVGFFGDFAAITKATVTNNLFVANPNLFYYCAYTGFSQGGKKFPTGTGNTWTGNVFQRGSNGKCGGNGPLADAGSGTGNVWSGNTWDDGTPLNLTG